MDFETSKRIRTEFAEVLNSIKEDTSGDDIVDILISNGVSSTFDYDDHVVAYFDTDTGLEWKLTFYREPNSKVTMIKLGNSNLVSRYINLGQIPFQIVHKEGKLAIV